LQPYQPDFGGSDSEELTLGSSTDIPGGIIWGWWRLNLNPPSPPQDST